MYGYSWNFWLKYSENFESEICTKFTENFVNILGKLCGRFSKSVKKFCEPSPLAAEVKISGSGAGKLTRR